MSDKNNKRYYWLKLQSTYFNKLEQKKMKKQENGKDMQIVYLRMMLYSIDKGGYIYFQGVYDTLEEELAEEFDEDVEIIRKTLDFLQKNKMITINENLDCFIPEVLVNTGSECDSAERMRKKRDRDKQSQCDSDVTMCDEVVTASDVEKEIEKEIEKENIIINYQEIINMYNDTCVSFPKVSKLSDKRKKAIKARLNNYTLEDFKKLFKMAESSSFLKGQNSRNWSATFDWLIADSNMAKVLDGNYLDKSQRQQYQNTPVRSSSQDFYDELYSKLTPTTDGPFA